MFQVKVYDSTNTTLKKVISPSDVISDISFSMNINGGLGQQSIELAWNINDTTVGLGDIVKITMYNENNKDGKQIYMWYVESVGRKQTTTQQTVTLNCLWVASLLTEYQNVVNYTSSDKAGDIAKNIIDAFNSAYGATLITYTSSTIDDWPFMWDWSFTDNYLKNLISLADYSWYNLFIDWEWVARFKQASTTPDHLFMNKKDIEEINIEEDLDAVVNSVYVYWYYRQGLWGWERYDIYIYSEYEDATSIATYGKRYEKVEIKTNSQTYIDNYAQQYVEDRKEPKKKTTLTINRKYNLEDIKPWDIIKINNFEYLLSWVKVLKVNYTPDKAILYLDEYISFGEEIKNSF